MDVKQKVQTPGSSAAPPASLESSERSDHGLQELSSARLDGRKPHLSHHSTTPPRHSGLDPESNKGE